MENKQPDIAELSILGWIVKKGIKNEKGEPLSFHDRLFLLDILTDWSRQIVIKKCSQVGGSVVFNLKVRNPVQRGQRFQRKADDNPVIADST